MKKLLICSLISIISGCSVTIICVEKTNCIHGHHNSPVITGSELKENIFRQSTDGNQPKASFK